MEDSHIYMQHSIYIWSTPYYIYGHFFPILTQMAPHNNYHTHVSIDHNSNIIFFLLAFIVSSYS